MTNESEYEAVRVRLASLSNEAAALVVLVHQIDTEVRVLVERMDAWRGQWEGGAPAQVIPGQEDLFTPEVE